MNMLYAHTVLEFGMPDKKFLELINIGLNTAFKLTAGSGIIIVIIYCIKIGQFPREISFGDGIIFTAISVIFGFFYFVSVYLFICLGAYTVKPMFYICKKIEFFINLYRSKTGLKPKYIRTPVLKTAHNNKLFASFGLLIIFFSIHQWVDVLAWLTCIFCSHVCLDKYSNTIRIKSNIKNKSPETITSRERSHLQYIESKKILLVCTVVLLITPLIITDIGYTIINGTMRLAKIRDENTTIYVSSPYVELLDEQGIHGAKSTIAGGFKKYEHSKILLNSFGPENIVEFDINKKRHVLSIPRDKMYIIN